MKTVKRLMARLGAFFTSGAAEEGLTKAADLVPMAVPIVQSIARLTPNRADDEIAAAFAVYAVPLAESWKAVPAEKRGYLLLDLATQVVGRKYPGVATNILNTAVQLAVTGSR
jgi:hypothetical protein